MQPMFLPDVEASPAAGPYPRAIEEAQRAGRDYQQIWHLFAYRPVMAQLGYVRE